MYRYDHVDETKLFQRSKTVRYCSRWCGNQSGSTSRDPKGEKAFGMEKGLCNYWYCISGSCHCNWFCVLWSKAWFSGGRN